MGKKKTTCKRYKSCLDVPDGQVMMGCRPAYTSKGSKNWSRCNMAQWGGPNKAKNLKFCKKEGLTHNCKYVKTNKRISNDQVDVQLLHAKMPVIWRKLDTKTRRKIVQLARK